MATPRTTEQDVATEDAALDAMIEQDPNELGRHNARFAGRGTHLWAVLNSLRRATGRVSTSPTDVAAAAKEWALSEDEVRAAIRY